MESIKVATILSVPFCPIPFCLVTEWGTRSLFYYWQMHINDFTRHGACEYQFAILKHLCQNRFFLLTDQWDQQYALALALPHRWHFSFEWKARGWRIEEADEDDVLWLAMTAVEAKKWCGVQVVYVIPKTWCSDWYGSVGKHEMRSDRGSRKGETGWWSSIAGWLYGKEFAKVRGLGRLQGVVD